MSRIDPDRRRLAVRVAIVALGLAFVPAAAGNHVDTSNPNKIVIKVPIDLVGGDDSYARRWNNAIKRFWNDGPGFGRWKYCGKSVEFEPDIQPIAAGEAGRPDAHKIRLKLVPDGVTFISNVDWSGPFSTDTIATGVWGSNVLDVSIRHEFGHLLGLPDEYKWIAEKDDLNHNGIRDPREPVEPDPGSDDSVMADHSGNVLQRLIDEAMSRNGVPDCKEVWTGTMHMNVRYVGSQGTCVATFDTDLLLQVRDGKVTGTAKVSRVPANSCRKSFSDVQGQTFTVSGKLTQNKMTLSIHSVWNGRLPRTGNTAAGPVTAQVPVPEATVYYDGIATVRCQTC